MPEGVSRDLKIRYASATDFREALSKAIGPGGPTFVRDPSGMVLEMTPLASATSDGGSNSATNPRALLAAVLATTEPWELARMLEAFERSVQGLLAGQATEPLGVLLRSLQDAAKDHAQKEPFKAVVTSLRNAFIGCLDTVLEWSSHPEHVLVSRWMIKLIGRDGTLPLLERLQQGTPRERLACVLALRLVEPKVADLVERVRLLPPQVMKAVIHDVAKWPEADALAFGRRRSALPRGSTGWPRSRGSTTHSPCAAARSFEFVCTTRHRWFEPRRSGGSSSSKMKARCPT